MKPSGRPNPILTLSDDEVRKLKSWASRLMSTQRIAHRA